MFTTLERLLGKQPLSEPRSEQQTAVSLAVFFGSLAQYLRPHAGLWAAIVFACSLETGFYWILPLAFRRLIDDTLAGHRGTDLLWILLALIGGSIVSSFASLWRGRKWAWLENQLTSDMRFQLTHHLHRLSSSFYARHDTGAILSRFSNDLAAVSNSLTMAVVWGLLPGIDCFLGTLILFVLDWRLALLSALVWPWCLLIPERIGRKAAAAAYDRKERESALLGVIQEQIAAHAVIRAYGLQRMSMAKYLGAEGNVFQSAVYASFYTAMMDQAAISGILVLQVLSLGGGAWLCYSGQMTIGTLAAFQALFMGVSTSLLYFSQYLRGLMPARAGMQRIHELLSESCSVEDAPDATALGPVEREIVFRDVSFGYEGKRALDGLSLRIACGSNVAIVGPSGSGKSTIVNLLLRFHDPDSGAVLIDGVDLRQVTQESWRRQTAIVFQDNILFQNSLAENIRLGRPGASDEDVREAARRAGIDQTIAAFPLGYATDAGERGGRLSGGERQRIALARALVRGPRVLILDEATSALDPQTEAEVNRTLRDVSRGRTVISVTHRISSVRDCDRIFVLDKGRLAEEGTHDELLRSGGLYAGLWHASAGSSVGAAGA